MATPRQQTEDDTQKQIDALKKKKEKLEAEKALLEAQLALEAAKDPHLLELKKKAAEAVALKDIAAAEKALAESNLEEWKAKVLGAVPAGPYKESMTLDEKAGQLESALLAVRALQEAARQAIVRIGGNLENAKEIVLYSEGNLPSFDNLMAFRVQKRMAVTALETAVKRSTAAPPTRTESLAAPAAIGASLEALDKLAGFFRSEYTMAGEAVTLGDSLLVKELIRNLKILYPGIALFVPSVYDPEAAQGSEVFEELIAASKNFEEANREARAQRKEVEVLKAEKEKLINNLEDLENQIIKENDPKKKDKLQRNLEDDAAERDKLEGNIKERKDVLDELEAAAGLFNKFFDRLLSKATDSGGIPLVPVLKEAAMEKRLREKEAYLLVAKIDLAGGSYFVKKNLWTFFGGMPLWHMGGTSISYLLMEGQSGRAVAGGSIPIHGGFIKAGKVQGHLQSGK